MRTAMLARPTIICFFCFAPTISLAQEALPAARVGDRTASGGVIVTGESSVLINGRPAATVSGITTNPSVRGAVPGVGGVILENGQVAGGDRIVTGASGVVFGSNVFINGRPAATAAPPAMPTTPTAQPKQTPGSQASRESARELVEFCGTQVAKFFEIVLSL